MIKKYLKLSRAFLKNHRTVLNTPLIFQAHSKTRFIIWSTVVLLLLVLAAAGPLITPHDPFEVNLAQVNRPPSGEYPLGTDYIGRCIMSRLIRGAARSIYSALIVVAVTFVTGTLIGTLGGFFGGMLDTVLMRTVDCFQAFPSLAFTIAVAGMLGSGTRNCIIAMTVAGWTGYARLARSQVLSVKERTFVGAARISGCSTMKILLRTVLPNCLNPLVVYASMHIGNTILSFAGLSYLGLGAAPPFPEWGTMLNDGRQRLQIAPWAVIFPGLAILLVVMVMGMFGDSINKWLTPKSIKDNIKN